MSRAIIFQFLGDCKIQDYKGPQFDQLKGEYNIQAEPLKRVAECEVASIFTAQEFFAKGILEGAEGQFFCLFDSKFLKFAFTNGTFLFGSAFKSHSKSWTRFDGASVMAPIDEKIKLVDGGYYVQLLYGNDPVDELMVNSLEEANHYYTAYFDRFCYACSDTAIYFDSTAVARYGSRFWVRKYDQGEFVSIQKELELALSGPAPERDFKDSAQGQPLPELFEIIGDGVMRFGVPRGHGIEMAITEGFELSNPADYEWDVSRRMTASDIVLVANQYSDSNPDDHFRDNKDYSERVISVSIHTGAELFSLMGERYLHNEVRTPLGIAIYSTLPEAEREIRNSIKSIGLAITDKDIHRLFEKKSAPYHLTVFQENGKADGTIETEVLFKREVSENSLTDNYKLLEEAAKTSKSDGKIFGVISERSPRAWAVDLYTKKQVEYFSFRRSNNQ